MSTIRGPRWRASGSGDRHRGWIVEVKPAANASRRLLFRTRTRWRRCFAYLARSPRPAQTAQCGCPVR